MVSSTGNVIRVPEPTIVLMVPAPIPAAKTARASQMDKAISFASRVRLPALQVEGPAPIIHEGLTGRTPGGPAAGLDTFCPADGLYSSSRPWTYSPGVVSEDRGADGGSGHGGR
ncbi:hypothetical protein GCM10009535_46000 [Streptomyces thermocarboxydovorans]|uniref:Uncharacterized protein n=1 Tax=Streptomyces thermocarboxydovorans TaxID=59298 RepID=A0ABP3SSB3_9ACTN